MPNGFEPFEPSAYDSATDWAQKVHREAFTRRKLIYTPDTLTSHTSQGTIHRLKPIQDQAPQAPPPGPVDFFTFSEQWTLVDGTNPQNPGADRIDLSPDRQIAPQSDIDIINAAPFPPLIWPQACVKLPGIIKPGWQVLVKVFQNQYFNDQVPGGNVFPTDQVTLSYRLITLPGQNTLSDSGYTPGIFFGGPISPASAIAMRDNGEGETWADAAIFHDTGDFINFDSADRSYIALSESSGSDINAGDFGVIYQNYGQILYPAGTILIVYGVAWDNSALAE